MNERTALRNTVDLLTILESVGVTAWVQDGTLLGLIRENRLIPWDRDTDTGCLITSWKPEAQAALEGAGFTLTTLGTLEDGWQHRWARDDEKTDIFFYYAAGGMIWHAAYLQGAQYRFTYEPFELERYRVLGVPLWVPSPPEAFLETKYGRDWRAPRKQWHYAKDPKNATRS